MAALGVTPHHRHSFLTTHRVLAGEPTSLDLFESDVLEAALPA